MARLERAASTSQMSRATNCTTPGYLVVMIIARNSCDSKFFPVCSHLCGQSRFLARFPGQAKSRKCPCCKGFRALAVPIVDRRKTAPKAGALPTALHPVIQFFIRLGVFTPKNRGARWMPFPDPARNTLFQRRACGRRRAHMLRYAGRSSASALPAARVFPFCASRRRGCLRFSPCPQACAVQKHPCTVCARIGPGQAANNPFTALQRKHYTRFFSP